MPREYLMRRKKGEGTCWYRQEGFWEGEITVGREEVTGKRIKRYATGDSPEAVLEKLRQEREEYLRANSQVPRAVSACMTLRGFVQAYWEPSVRLGVSARSLDRMLLDWGYVGRYMGGVPLGEITPGLILRVMSQMSLDGLSDYQRFKGAKILRRILAHAVRLDFLVKSPAQGIPLPRYAQGEIRPMTPEQVSRFLEANKEDRWFPFGCWPWIPGPERGNYLPSSGGIGILKNGN